MLVGEDLVDAGAVEVAVGEIANAVELQGDFLAVVDEPRGFDRAGASAVGIDALGNAVVEDVVGVLDGGEGFWALSVTMTLMRRLR